MLRPAAAAAVYRGHFFCDAVAEGVWKEKVNNFKSSNKIKLSKHSYVYVAYSFRLGNLSSLWSSPAYAAQMGLLFGKRLRCQVVNKISSIHWSN